MHRRWKQQRVLEGRTGFEGKTDLPSNSSPLPSPSSSTPLIPDPTITTTGVLQRKILGILGYADGDPPHGDLPDGISSEMRVEEAGNNLRPNVRQLNPPTHPQL
jgi:hypothetical protein